LAVPSLLRLPLLALLLTARSLDVVPDLLDMFLRLVVAAEGDALLEA